MSRCPRGLGGVGSEEEGRETEDTRSFSWATPHKFQRYSQSSDRGETSLDLGRDKPR